MIARARKRKSLPQGSALKKPLNQGKPLPPTLTPRKWLAKTTVLTEPNATKGVVSAGKNQGNPAGRERAQLVIDPVARLQDCRQARSAWMTVQETSAAIRPVSVSRSRKKRVARPTQPTWMRLTAIPSVPRE